MPIDQTSPENFHLLLAWLGTDREKGAQKYEQIRQNLLDYFRRRGVTDPISLADEVIIRVTRKINRLVGSFVGDPSPYFLAVARRVLAEHWRAPLETELPAEIPVFSDSESGHKALIMRGLEHCWARLSAEEQDTVYRYCVERPPVKLRDSRDLLAKELGLTLNALRVMSHRLRRKLKICIEKFVAKN